MTRSARFLVATTVAALALPGSALAGGGTTIGSAPTINPGETVSANSATDPTGVGDQGVGFESGCWDAIEYWKVPLTAGDTVTISVTIGVPTYNLEIGVFPAGTSDRTLANAKSVKTGLPTDKVPLELTAPTTGTYVVAAGPNCYNGAGGPFTFVVSVAPHAGATAKPTVSLPAIAHIAASGTIAASVRAGGSPVTDPSLTLKLYGTWGGATHLLATAAPKNGKASFAYHLPAGVKGRVTLHVGGAAPGAPLEVIVS